MTSPCCACVPQPGGLLFLFFFFSSGEPSPRRWRFPPTIPPRHAALQTRELPCEPSCWRLDAPQRSAGPSQRSANPVATSWSSRGAEFKLEEAAGVARVHVAGHAARGATTGRLTGHDAFLPPARASFCFCVLLMRGKGDWVHKKKNAIRNSRERYMYARADGVET